MLNLSADPYFLPLLSLVMCVLLILILFVRTWLRVQDDTGRWRQLLGCAVPVYWIPASHCDPALLARSMSLAVECLRKHADWNAGILASAISGARIYVYMQVEPPSLHESHSEGIRGAADVHVDAQFLNLCHELAHHVESRVEHHVDKDHVSWQTRGIRAADRAYQLARLSSVRAPDNPNPKPPAGGGSPQSG